MRLPIWVGVFGLASCLACGCNDHIVGAQEPLPNRVSPDVVQRGVETDIIIEGDRFLPDVQISHKNHEQSQFNASFSARLNERPLHEVSYLGPGTLLARVPADLATGWYDLHVQGPSGGVGTLKNALQVVASADTGPRGLDTETDSDAYIDTASEIICTSSNGCYDICNGGNCTAECSASAVCGLGCAGGSCHLDCLEDATCDLHCAGGDCSATKEGDGRLVVTCAGGGCTATCADDSICILFCDGGGCSIDCRDDARCELYCSGEDCSLDNCNTSVQECEELFVCNGLCIDDDDDDD